jgi:hypothetical protein
VARTVSATGTAPEALDGLAAAVSAGGVPFDAELTVVSGHFFGVQ